MSEPVPTWTLTPAVQEAIHIASRWLGAVWSEKYDHRVIAARAELIAARTARVERIFRAKVLDSQIPIGNTLEHSVYVNDGEISIVSAIVKISSNGDATGRFSTSNLPILVHPYSLAVKYDLTVEPG